MATRRYRSLLFDHKFYNGKPSKIIQCFDGVLYVEQGLQIVFSFVIRVRGFFIGTLELVVKSLFNTCVNKFSNLYDLSDICRF